MSYAHKEQNAISEARFHAQEHLRSAAVELEDAITDLNFAGEDSHSVDVSTLLAGLQDKIEALEDRAGDYDQ